MKAWLFLRSDGRLNWDDKHLVRRNVWMSVKGKIILGENGMHGYGKLIDAFLHAPGSIACRVKIKGEIIQGDTKLVGRRMKVMAMGDATNVLYWFACWCANRALKAKEKAGQKTDYRSWCAIEARRQWLGGEIDDNRLNAAHVTAKDIAYTAGCSAAYAAAYAAGRSPAYFTANSASCYAERFITGLSRSIGLLFLKQQNRYLTKAISRLLKAD